MNTYVVDSDYGQFLAYGDMALARLVREIGAMDQLEDVSKAEVFTQSMFDSATGDLKTISHLAQHPVGTVKGLPGGIGRMFHKYSKTANHLIGGDDGGSQRASRPCARLGGGAQPSALES